MLKVFEAFAGYGSQRTALKNIGIEHEVVGISEIDGDVILSYAAIHTDFLKLRKINSDDYTSTDEKYEYLEGINVPLEYKTFNNRARKLNANKLDDMFLANKLTKNYGDILKINPEKLPDFDFFTYSFPCQDISVAGYQNGLSANSGTRSSLLWECCKIIEIKKPRYLMMENVKNLIGKNHIGNFNKFLDYLESLGYTNKWHILNARDFGVPQSRERVFCISTLKKNDTFEFPTPIPLELKMNDLLEKNVSSNFYLSKNQTTDFPIEQEVSYCLDSNYWKGTMLQDFLTKRRRQVVSGPQTNDGLYPARRLTPLETWRFMGCSDDDFYKANEVVSNTALYRQAGNSIVIPVLEALFKNLFMQKEEELVMSNKEKIIQLFNTNVKGKTPDTTGANVRHDGRQGHWLERQFGISANANNASDLFGYELKNETTSKTTFGDWSANRYIHKQGPYVQCFAGSSSAARQDSFCAIFGKPNAEKAGRCSWSGSPCPTIHGFNSFGQKLLIAENKDIIAVYSYSMDQRTNKSTIIPLELQQENLEVARWFGLESPSAKITDKCLKKKLEDKFNDSGWFTCKKGTDGSYQKICFGEPMTYDNWITLVEKGIVFFDSGMYQTNKRPYSMWRANNAFWESLIVDCYE